MADLTFTDDDEIQNVFSSEGYNDPRNFLSPRVREYYDNAYEYINKFDKEEEWQKAGIASRDHIFRHRMWRELEDCARGTRTRVSVARIVDGQVTLAAFYTLLRNPIRTGYIFTKPMDFELTEVSMLSESYLQLKEILSMNMYSDRAKKKPIPSIVNAKLKVITLLANRVRGQAIQRVQQHSVIENKQPKLLSADEISKELKRLEASSAANPSKQLEAVEAETIEGFLEEPPQDNLPASLQSRQKTEGLDDDT